MTLTVEVAPEIKAWLEQEAARRGVPLYQLASEMLEDALQDLQDVEEARRILADGSEPNIPWEQVKAELKLPGQMKNEQKSA